MTKQIITELQAKIHEEIKTEKNGIVFHQQSIKEAELIIKTLEDVLKWAKEVVPDESTELTSIDTTPTESPTESHKEFIAYTKDSQEEAKPKQNYDPADILIPSIDFDKSLIQTHGNLRYVLFDDGIVMVGYGMGTYFTTIEKLLKIPYPTPSGTFSNKWNNNNRQAIKGMRALLANTEHDPDRPYYKFLHNDHKI